MRRSESTQQSSAIHSLHLNFWGLRKIVACSHSSSQCLLVSTVLGTVSSLHPTSFLSFVLVIIGLTPYLNIQEGIDCDYHYFYGHAKERCKQHSSASSVYSAGVCMHEYIHSALQSIERKHRTHTRSILIQEPCCLEK